MATEADFNAAFDQLFSDVASTISFEASISGKPQPKLVKLRSRKRKDRDSPDTASGVRKAREVTSEVLSECIAERQRVKAASTPTDTSDLALSQMAGFTDHFRLAPFGRFLHYVPRLVNVVTLAEAIPVVGSGMKLPLDLQLIATRCENSFYAPKKFSAVQLAYAEPRCRVLVFHTGRMVGTGTNGPMAARLALLKAQRQLYTDAGVHIVMKNFAVINTVGAASLRATLECDKFAEAHTSTAFYDSKSFVGLAWRPAAESICCEIYSTGRCNLPGSTVERDLQQSFYCMLPELLRFSSAARLVELIPEEVRAKHRIDERVPQNRAQPAQPAQPVDLWEGWGGASGYGAGALGNDVDEEEEEEEVDLSEMGL